MTSTDRESKTRFLFLLAVPVLLFGGSALWGVRERAGNNTPPNWVESPAEVSAERAERIAKGREAFALRRQLSVLGKKQRWHDAAALVTDDFLARNDFRNLRFLRGEAWLRAEDKRGAVALHRALKSDKSLPPHEADLLIGNANRYRADTASALRVAEVSRIAPADANNLAWRVALAPNLADAVGLEKAKVLSEYAVNMARKGGDKDTLATNTNTLGAIYFRAGHGKEAVRILTESDQIRSDPFNAAFLALAYRDLGDTRAATQWRNRLQAYLDGTYATRDGQTNRHQLLLLWRETQESASKTAN